MSALNKVRSGAAAVAPMEQMSQPDDMCFTVRDVNASKGPRTHIMLDQNKREVPYVFPDQHTAIKVPYQHAVQFARDDAFEVVDNAGRRWKTAPIKGGNKQGVQLARNEVVANLDELTRKALDQRAKKAGGEFKANATNAQIIEFLVQMAGLRMVQEGSANEPEYQEEQPAEEPAAGDVEFDEEA